MISPMKSEQRLDDNHHDNQHSVEKVALAIRKMAEYSLDFPCSHSTTLSKTNVGTSTIAAQHSSNSQIAFLLHFPTDLNSASAISRHCAF